jgi:hypothetical protein
MMTRAVLVLAICACGEKRLDPQPVRPPPPPTEDTTTYSGPDAPGKLPMSEVETHMGGVRDALKACAERTTYEGTIQIRIVIAPSGSSTATITDHGIPSAPPEIDDCVTQATSTVVFPESEKGQQFVYSYTF